jgi:hypothetical protein
VLTVDIHQFRIQLICLRVAVVFSIYHNVSRSLTMISVSY